MVREGFGKTYSLEIFVLRVEFLSIFLPLPRNHIGKRPILDGWGILFLYVFIPLRLSISEHSFNIIFQLDTISSRRWLWVSKPAEKGLIE